MTVKKKPVQLTSSQLIVGMTIRADKKIYRVESCVVVKAPRGAPFVKTKLKQLNTDEEIEKNFKLDQPIEEVSLVEKALTYLYLEGKNYLFLDVDDLEHVELSSKIVSDKSNFLKEGIEVKASCFGETVFSIDLPQFLELMVVKTDESTEMMPVSNTTKKAQLETGAKLDVPLFIEPGDVVKVDTHQSEFIQRL